LTPRAGRAYPNIMITRPIERWTLRELLNGSDRACREIVEHLNTDYVPAVRELGKLLRPYKGRKAEVGDRTIVNTIARLEKSETYASDLIGQLEQILAAIHRHAQSGRSENERAH
jgi:hypothetical protein